MKILVTLPENTYKKKTFFTERSKRRIEELGEIIYNPYERELTPDELAEMIKGIDILITGWQTPMVTETVLKNADSLKMIAHTGGTVAPNVCEEVFNRKIIVLSGNILFAESVAESCICYIMAVLRDVVKHSETMRLGGWKDSDYYNEGIMDKTVGIVGFGMIAKFLVKMLQPFHCKIKIFSRYLTDEEAEKYNAKKATLNEIFESCDVISIHASGGEKNYHLVGEEQIKKMKDGALIVNTARGPIIDEEALIKELETLRIRAALDVYKKEPPEKNSKLRFLPNVLTMPHMGGPTIDRREYVTLALADDIEDFLNGKKEGFYCEITPSYAKNMSSK